MNVALDAGAAVYVAMAVTLSVWIGIFVYLWRIDVQARALRRELEREDRREQPAPPRSTVTRVREGEPVEK
ncbi:MAG: CcmD family protein [Chloroflexales bacterium]